MNVVIFFLFRFIRDIKLIKKGVILYGFVTLAIAYFGGHVTWCDVWDCDNKSVVLVDVFLWRVGG